MLAWALEQCRTHPHLSRIIVVLPYLTIMEQTAQVYRDSLAGWLPEELRSRAILEHHSLASWKSIPFGRQPDDEQDRNGSHLRFLAENWDAPIVVTSTVQFFESLFANSPSACRKLHRIANSVILLDEVQTLRPSLILPTLGALSTLVQPISLFRGSRHRHATGLFSFVPEGAGNLPQQVTRLNLSLPTPNRFFRDAAHPRTLAGERRDYHLGGDRQPHD